MRAPLAGLLLLFLALPASAIERPPRSWVRALIVNSEYDSNVLQSPESPDDAPSAEGDLSYFVFGFQDLQQVPVRGSHLRASFFVKDFARLHQLDMLGGSAGLQQDFRVAGGLLKARYDGHHFGLGGRSYLWLHMAGLEHELPLGRPWKASYAYLWSGKRFTPRAFRGLSGSQHRLTMKARRRFTSRLSEWLGRIDFFREDADEGRFDHAGVRLQTRVLVALPWTLRLKLEPTLRLRRYGGRESAASPVREEARQEYGAWISRSFAGSLSLEAGHVYTINRSTLARFNYRKSVFQTGVSLAF